VSPALVTRWTKAGRLVLVDGKVDRDASDALLARSLNPTHGGRRVAGGSVGATVAGTPVVEEIARHAAVDRDYAGRIRRLEYERRAGLLVPRKAVELAAQHAADSARKMLERLPDRLAPRLAAESDARRVRALLLEEIEALSREIASAAEAMPDKLTAAQ
jgi:hypothetical protein